MSERKRMLKISLLYFAVSGVFLVVAFGLGSNLFGAGLMFGVGLVYLFEGLTGYK